MPPCSCGTEQESGASWPFPYFPCCGTLVGLSLVSLVGDSVRTRWDINQQ